MTLVVIREVLQRGIVTIRFKWIKMNPVIRDGEKNQDPDPGSGPGRTYRFVGLKILKFFVADPDPRSGIVFTMDPGWKNSDPGSGINIRIRKLLFSI